MADVIKGNANLYRLSAPGNSMDLTSRGVAKIYSRNASRRQPVGSKFAQNAYAPNTTGQAERRGPHPIGIPTSVTDDDDMVYQQDSQWAPAKSSLSEAKSLEMGGGFTLGDDSSGPFRKYRRKAIIVVAIREKEEGI